MLNAQYLHVPVSSCNGILELEYQKEEEHTRRKLICNTYPNRHKFDFYISELYDRNK